MSDCEKFAPALSAHLDGELPAEKRDELEKHLAECDECRRLLSEWEEAAQVAGRVAEPDEDTWEAVWRHVAAAAARRRSAARLKRDITRAFAVAAVAAAVLVAAFLYGPESTTTQSQTAGPAEYELVDLEVAPEYTVFVMTSEEEPVPVIWLEKI